MSPPSVSSSYPQDAQYIAGRCWVALLPQSYFPNVLLSDNNRVCGEAGSWGEEGRRGGEEKVPWVSVGGSQLFVLLRFMMGFSGEQRMEKDTPLPPTHTRSLSPYPPPLLPSPPEYTLTLTY